MVLCRSCHTSISDFWNFKTRTSRDQNKFHPPEIMKVKEELEESDAVLYSTVDIVRNFIEKHSIATIQAEDEGERLIIYSARREIKEELEEMTFAEAMLDDLNETENSVKTEHYEAEYVEGMIDALDPENEFISEPHNIEDKQELEEQCLNNDYSENETIMSPDDASFQGSLKVDFISRVPESLLEALQKPSDPKRPRNPENWKIFKKKMARLRGEAYMTDSGKLVPAKKMLDHCGGCRLKCPERINDKDRQKNFDLYYSMDDAILQRKFIFEHRQILPVKRRYTKNEAKARKFSSIYFLDTWKPDGTVVMVQVCEKTFTSTLNICRGIISTLQKKVAQGRVEDRRGVVVKNKSEAYLAAIDHVQANPFFHIERQMSMTQMFKNYQDQCREKGIEPVRDHTYRLIFSKYNECEFLKQEKVICDVCDRYYKATDEEKQELHARYQEHISIQEKCMQRAKSRVRDARKRERKIQKRLLAKAEQELESQEHVSMEPSQDYAHMEYC